MKIKRKKFTELLNDYLEKKGYFESLEKILGVNWDIKIKAEKELEKSAKRLNHLFKRCYI